MAQEIMILLPVNQNYRNATEAGEGFLKGYVFNYIYNSYNTVKLCEQVNINMIRKDTIIEIQVEDEFIIFNMKELLEVTNA
jgi:hypothetical protein